MDVGRNIRLARRRAGLTQRQLAAATGISQPTIAKLERGVDDPRLSTVQRLLEASGEELVSQPRRGTGIDRSEMRELLRMTPAERLRLLVEEVRFLEQLDRARQLR